ncbi:MAG: AtpZ/AtpI family protein [Sphingomonas sp.]|uniref:AtpZ/AtpI family protein n=1 Tax=Sphingomonas sp. TaxID=28214 RepID=UPI001AC270AE|nr:AtpZ/AtpI family protein [Sphingomonas sp.]MBN8816965.1 AtpZ/AtpI family protein [Sphingomonas sp.]
MADNSQIDDLDRRIANARAVEEARVGTAPAQPAKGYGQGSRVLMELIGAPLGGGVLGWAIDHWFTGSHWGLIVGIALGVVVAFRNIFRISKERAE